MTLHKINKQIVNNESYVKNIYIIGDIHLKKPNCGPDHTDLSDFLENVFKRTDMLIDFFLEIPYGLSDKHKHGTEKHLHDVREKFKSYFENKLQRDEYNNVRFHAADPRSAASSEVYGLIGEKQTAEVNISEITGIHIVGDILVSLHGKNAIAKGDEVNEFIDGPYFKRNNNRTQSESINSAINSFILATIEILKGKTKEVVRKYMNLILNNNAIRRQFEMLGHRSTSKYIDALKKSISNRIKNTFEKETIEKITNRQNVEEYNYADYETELKKIAGISDTNEFGHLLQENRFDAKDVRGILLELSNGNKEILRRISRFGELLGVIHFDIYVLSKMLIYKSAEGRNDESIYSKNIILYVGNEHCKEIRNFLDAIIGFQNEIVFDQELTSEPTKQCNSLARLVQPLFL